MIETYKFRIYPTKEQEVLLQKHFGCVRFVYNWALDFNKKLKDVVDFIFRHFPGFKFTN